MSRFLLSIILIATPLVQLRGQMLRGINANVVTASGPATVNPFCQVLGVNGGTTSPISTIGANFIAVAVVWSASISITLTENGGNGAPNSTLTKYTRPVIAGAVEWFYWENPTVQASHTFTVTGAGQASGICVIPISGMLTSSTFDTGTDSGSTTGTTTCSPGNITPSSGRKVILTAINGGATATTFAIDSSFVTAGQFAGVGGVNYGGAAASLIQTTGATVNPTWTVDAGLSGCAIAAFKGQ